MAYAYSQGALNSSATTVSTLSTSAAITPLLNTFLVIAVVAGSADTLSIGDAGAGNTYTPFGAALNDGTHGLYTWYCQAAAHVATTFTVTGSANILGIYVANYTGIATSGAFINTVSQAQSAPGTGTDAITSTAVNVALVPAMLWGFAFDSSLLGHFSANSGTSFTGSHSVGWATMNGGSNNPALAEDRRITATSSLAATFTAVNSAAGSDSWLTVVAAFGEPGAASSFATVAWLT
jgi:hypothetical protein